MLKQILSACLFFSICITSFSYAVNRTNTYGVMFAGGYQFFSLQRNFHNTGVGVITANYQFNNRWGIEGLIGLFNTKQWILFSEDRRVTGRLYLLNGTYHFSPDNRWSPYLTAGVGVSNIHPNETNATSQGNINAGAGLQFYADEIVSLRVEARDLYTFTGSRNDVLLLAGVNFAIIGC